jgi:hypothetical protein
MYTASAVRSVRLAALLTMVVGCAGSPKGASLDPQVSGLAGSWIPFSDRSIVAPSEGVSWNFRTDGTYEFQKGNSGARQQGRWRTYRSAAGDQRNVVCFDERPRRSPSCRYFRVEAQSAGSGPSRRRLEWEGWIGEKKMLTERFLEAVP